MLWGVEIVQDKEKLLPYPRKEEVAERLWQHLFREGIILYKGLAGGEGDALVVAPPFTITSDEVSLLVDKLGRAVEEVLG